MAGALASLAHGTPDAGAQRVDDRETIAERARSGGVAYEDFIEKPTAYKPAPRRLMVVDRRSDSRVSTARFAAVAVPAVLVVGATLLFGRTDALMSGWFAAVALASFGIAVAVRRNVAQRAEAFPLAWIDATRGELRVREYPTQEGLSESVPIEFNEVEQVLFATRRIKPPALHGRGSIEASGVFIRLLDGTVWPIIPSTLDRESAFAIAGRVASLVGVGVKQVGSGWSD